MAVSGCAAGGVGPRQRLSEPSVVVCSVHLTRREERLGRIGKDWEGLGRVGKSWEAALRRIQAWATVAAPGPIKSTDSNGWLFSLLKKNRAVWRATSDQILKRN